MNKITALIEMYTEHLNWLKKDRENYSEGTQLFYLVTGKIETYKHVIKDLNTIIDNA